MRDEQTLSGATILRYHLANDALRTACEQYLRSILANASEIGDGSFTYDDEKGHAEKYLVAGNGPTAYLVFVEFASDDVTGYLEYADSNGTTITYVPDVLVKPLRTALRADAKVRNA